MRWGVLFGALVIVIGCSGKSESDDDDSGGSQNDAGQGGTSGSGGTGKGGSGQGGGSSASGGSTSRGGTGGGAAAGGGVGTGVGGTSSGGTGVGASGVGGSGVGGTAGLGEAGQPGTSGTGGTVDANCTDLTTDAPLLTLIYGGTTTPPEPQGGSIESGTYYFATQTNYGTTDACINLPASYAALGIALTEVFRFDATSSSAGSLEAALEASSQGETSRNTAKGTYTTSGTLLTVVTTCGSGSDGAPAPVPYTAAGGEIIVFDDGKSECSPVMTVLRKL